MSRHNTIRVSLATAVAALAIGVPTASAMPIKDGTPPIPTGPHAAKFYDAGHASVATALSQNAAKASLVAEQSATRASAQDVLVAQSAGQRIDLRSPDAKDAAIVAARHDAVARADLRSPDTRDAALNASRGSKPVLQGPPQFSSTNVTALHSTQPVKDTGNDVPLLGIILGLVGAGLLGVGAAVAVSKTTRSRRTRAIA